LPIIFAYKVNLLNDFFEMLSFTSKIFADIYKNIFEFFLYILLKDNKH